MSVPARRVVSAGNALARERLAAYVRYAGLVAEQERALQREDLERFRSLAEDLEGVQEEISRDGGILHDLSDDAELGSEGFVGKVSALLFATIARNERIQARLQALRHKDGTGLHEATLPPVAPGYGSEVGPAPAADTVHLDVKL